MRNDRGRGRRLSVRGAPAMVVLCATAAALGQAAEPFFPRSLLLSFDPILENRANRRVHEVFGWQDASTLTDSYVTDFGNATYGLILHRVTRRLNPDVFPVKADGFRYNDTTFQICWPNGTCHQPDGVDYRAVCRDYDLARKVDSGELDEVLMHGAPYFGYYESRMAGRGGYWCNSPPQSRVACSKIFVIMGFNYERGVAEMLHSCGHRSESIMSRTYGFWDITQSRHDWERFTQNVGQSPNVACGSVHYPPNGVSDYDYANTQSVVSTSIDWLNNFPNLTGQTSVVSRNTWGGPDYHRNYMKWWYAHMPHVGGTNNHDGYLRLNNWYQYLFNFNAYAESGGDHVPGGAAPAATPYASLPHALTANTRDDWAPRINAAGRVVWHGSDGGGFEIFSANRDGSDLVQITNNAYSDEDPKINAAGRVVWQAFDGRDYEVFSANADGTDLVQITANNTDDWHPSINDAGRVVWDGFDGEDYEIFSANADGTGLTQLTNNSHGGVGYPREDVWPQINNSGRVVWFGYDGNDWEVYSAGDDGSGLVNVSNNSRDDEYPQINDAGTVVWHSYHSDTNAEIYSGTATGGSVVRLTNNSVEDWYPQVNAGGTVVWMSRLDGDWDIQSAPASGGTITYVSANSTHDQYPQIDATGRVVWQGFDGQDWEIYARIGTAVYQLTDNDYDDRWPHINDNEETVWHAASGVGAVSDSTEIFSSGPEVRAPADFDEDGDVDLSDFGFFLIAFNGPAQPPALLPEGYRADFDDDQDVDLADFAVLLSCFNGPNRPAACL